MNLNLGPAFTRAQAVVNALVAAIVKGVVALSVALPTYMSGSKPHGADGE